MLQVEIHIKGQIGEQWSDWFEGLTITPCETNKTILTGTVADQTALYSLLSRARDLGLALISVQAVEVGKENSYAPNT